MAAIKEHYALNTDNAHGDFFDFFDKGNSQPDAGIGSLQRVIIIHGNVDNGDFLARSPDKDDRSDGRFVLAIPVKGKERLSFMVANLHMQASGSFFHARVAKFLERVQNPVPDTMLARIEKQQIFQFRFAFERDPRGKDQVHARFFD